MRTTKLFSVKSRRCGHKSLLKASTILMTMVLSPSAYADNGVGSYTSYPISTNPSDWQVDRAQTATPLTNIGTYEGQDNVLMFGIAPPAAGQSFYNYQGYTQRTSVPAGNSFIGGEMWVDPSWSTGTATNYIDTGMWGSAMPSATVAGGSYVDSQATFPIMTFTNQDGAGHLEVYDTNANPTTGWVQLPDTASLINYGAWNTIAMTLLPDKGEIQYYLNGTLVYTWNNPSGDDLGSLPQQFWAMYLEGYNNDETTFNTYWSNLLSGTLLSNGQTIGSSDGNVVVSPTPGNTTPATVSNGAQINGSLEATGAQSMPALVDFDGNAAITQNVIANNAVLSFSKDAADSVSIGGDVSLQDATTTGGNVANPIQIAGNVTVDSMSTLGGNLDITGNVLSQGTLNPGNSVGVIKVSGNLTDGPNSTYAVQINLEGQSDLVSVGGSAALAGGVNVSPIDGYLYGYRYTILTAAGGLDGTSFDASNVTWDEPSALFIAPQLSYDANDVYLTIGRNGTSFAAVADTRNQAAAASGLDSLSFGNAAYTAVASMTSASTARAAFDQLSGEIYPSIKTALIDQSEYTRDAATNRLRQAFCSVGGQGGGIVASQPGKPGSEQPCSSSRLTIWGYGVGAWDQVDGNSNASTMKSSTGGFLIGLDKVVFDSWRVGLLGGYSRSNYSVNARNSSGNSNNYTIGVYGGTQWHALGFRTGAAYSWSNINANRSVAFPGFLEGVGGHYSARLAQMFGDVGYDLQSGSLGLEPFADLAYVNLETDGFSEQAGPATLIAQSGNTSTAFSTFGVRSSIGFSIERLTLHINTTLGWRHAYGTINPTTSMAFADGSSFSVAGVPIARDAAVIDAGLSLPIRNNLKINASYSGEFGDRMQDQGVNGSLAWTF